MGMCLSESVYDRVVSAFRETMSYGPDDKRYGVIAPKANMKTDLGMDSLESLEMVMSLEEHYNIDIPMDDAAHFHTIQDIVSYIESVVNN